MIAGFKCLLIVSAVAAIAVTGLARAQTAGDSSTGSQTGTGDTTDGMGERGTVGPTTNPPGTTDPDDPSGMGGSTNPSGTMDDGAAGTGTNPPGTTGGAIDDGSMDDNGATGERPPRADRD